MKKFFAILCILLLTLPMCAFATKSPTIPSKIYSQPEIKFEVVNDILTILDLDRVMPYDELEGYLWREALSVELDKEYEVTKWHLLFDLAKVEDVKVVIIGESIIVQQAPIEKDMITVDFTGLTPSTYYVCFFTKEAV